MQNIGWFVPQYLNISETFIHEPLQKFKQFYPLIFTGRKKNLDKFPYPDVYSSSQDITGLALKVNDLLAIFGRERFFADLIKNRNVCLLHAHFGVNGNFALQFKKRLNIPLIVQFYGADLYRWGRDPYNKYCYHKLFKKADLFLVCSDKMKRDLIAYGCPHEKVKRFYLGLDLNKFPVNLRKNNNNPNQPVKFLMCGRFVEKKGFEYAIQAFEGIPKDEYLLNIIGSGDLQSKYEQIAKDSGVIDNISFMGSASYAEYIDSLYQTDVLIVPSVTAKSGDSEGLPMVLLEGVASGAVTIASEHAGIPEVVKDGETGFLTPERDVAAIREKIKHVIANRDEFDKLRSAGRKIIETEFDLDKQIVKLEDIYNRLIKENSK
ncbi:MAG: glycosyltransferase [Candidatus Margulisiibacteriota bacterium]